ncbi:hypothetical protein DRH27_02935, partial [Candidatus Falkowbacteria bacterium]
AIKLQLAKFDGHAKLGWRAANYHAEADKIIQIAIKRATKQNKNILYDGTMKNLEKYIKKIDEFKKAGYKIKMAYADLPMEKTMVRAIGRAYGHDARFVDPVYIASHGKRNLRAFNQLKKQVDEWVHYNTDVPYKTKPTLVARSKPKKPTKPTAPKIPKGKSSAGSAEEVAAFESPLVDSPVSSKEYLGGGINETFKIKTIDGQRSVWKSKSGERTGVRKFVKNKTSYKRENAASRVNNAMGFDLCPRTVIKTVDKEVGSAQNFVGGDTISGIGRRSHTLKMRAMDADVQRMATFDFVIGNSDRHLSNVMYDVAKKKLWGIDNGLAFNNYNMAVKNATKHNREHFIDSLRSYALNSTKVSGKTISKEAYAGIERLIDNEKYVRGILKGRLTTSEVDGMFMRAKYLHKTKKFPTKTDLYSYKVVIGKYKSKKVIVENFY